MIHIRHILVRDVIEVGHEMVEVIRCSMCDMPPVRRPDDMPDYSQVDRLWRTR